MYQAYLESPTWRRVRIRALADAGNACERCGAGDQTLNVHHRTYERVGGRELPEDLEVLCEPCHVRHHEYARAYIAFIGTEGPDSPPTPPRIEGAGG
jgi:5-methylcytosine-specific restriction endonuclease McrA